MTFVSSKAKAVATRVSRMATTVDAPGLTLMILLLVMLLNFREGSSEAGAVAAAVVANSVDLEFAPRDEGQP